MAGFLYTKIPRNLHGCGVSLMVIQEGFEPPTHGLEGRCSIQLSYRLMKAGDGNRTHVISLEGWSSTIELHPLTVGVTGFEPATSWSQIKRSSQAEPHPVSALLFLYFFNSKIYYIESSFKCQQLFSTFFIFLEHFVANPLFMRFLTLYFFIILFIFLRPSNKIIGKSY